MKILVDTSVWSMVLRRKNPDIEITDKLKVLIKNGEQIYLIGIILQEILSGVKEETLFEKLVEDLSAFPLIELGRDDYVDAAKLRNHCNSKGIQASTIDFLIASICISNDLLLFSTDKDFQLIAKLTNLKLL